jgi:hypothetical protein
MKKSVGSRLGGKKAAPGVGAKAGPIGTTFKDAVVKGVSGKR